MIAKMPFRTDAVVLMPSRIRAIWILPEGDVDYSTRWKLIKAGFSKRLLRGGLAPTLRLVVDRRFPKATYTLSGRSVIAGFTF